MVALHLKMAGYLPGAKIITLSVTGIAPSGLPGKGKISIARREAQGLKSGGKPRLAKHFVQALLVISDEVWQIDYTDLYLKLSDIKP